MKHFTAFFLFLIASILSQAQNSDAFFKAMPYLDGSEPEWAKLMYSENPNVGEVEDLFRKYYSNHEFNKNLHTQNHKHWIRLVEPLLDDNGYIVQKSQNAEDSLFHKKRNGYQTAKESSGASQNWVAMGPFETYKSNTTQPISWHKNIYSIDQSLSNPNLLICGTEAGGVYKSMNKGADWILISKGEVFAGSNSAVKIHPTDTNIFLVASNNRIYQSLDGGATWLNQHYTNGTGNEFQYSPANDSVVFHTSTTGLFKSIDGGGTWTQIYADKCWDIDFHPTDSSIAYLLKSNIAAKRSELFRSKDGGTTWALQDSGYYSPIALQATTDLGGKIAVTPASPSRVYVALIGNSKAGDDGWISVYRSDDTASTWINPSGQDGGPYSIINGNAKWNVAAYSGGYHQGFFNFDMEASATNANKIWIATIRLTESSDGGQTFQSIGAANSNRLSDIHADVQDIEVNGSDVWVASDGGINYSTDQLVSHVALNRGIQAAHFWGFNTGWNEDSYTGGKYHDGTSGWFESYSSGKAYNIGGVEEASGYVHPIESRKMLFRTHYSSKNTSVKTIPKTFGGTVITNPDLPIRPNESYLTAERSGVYYHPLYANYIYVGLNNKIFMSTNGGGRFKVLHAFPDSTGKVYEIEIARSNPNVMYAVYNPTGSYWASCEVWKSTNGGNNWSKTMVTSGNRRRYRLSIHPENANEVWLCTPRGSNGNKVFSTSNGGAMWVNRTTSVLDGENLTDIMYQAGTNDLVYVVSQNGVFYWDATTNNWIDYSLGLPLIANSLQINPFYRDGELRLASSGRGVWRRAMKDTLFYPIAQPITYADTIYCINDTAFFDCYSILKHEGATWYWNISPAPAYISSDSIRNPKVLFGADGSYTVALTITDNQGNSDTKSVTDMVTVASSCEPDSVPGKAMHCKSNVSYAQTGSLNLLSTDSLTISAWVKPDGLQNDYTGIVFGDQSQSAGLNVRTGNILGYHWPGGQWWWNSGLTLPQNEWSHVAMVVTPTGITLYLNGMASKHTFNLTPVDITTFKMGSYKGWSNRNFNGRIDEVCIWNKALSQNEIRELRHLTRTGPQSFIAGLVAYYQFNSPQADVVLNKVGSSHASLVGDAQKVISTGPFGGGASDRSFIGASGNYSFVNTETEMQFSGGSPNGEIVISRINGIPDSLPNPNPHTGNYWILNNYGTQTFGAINPLKLRSKSGVPYGNTNNIVLYSRSVNEDVNNWISACNAFSKTGNTYNFNGACSLTNQAQFFVQSANKGHIRHYYYPSSVAKEICGNDSIFLEGGYQNTSGIYRDTNWVSLTEDSVISTFLTVIGLDTTLGQNGYTLTSNQAGAKYQWLDCDNGFAELTGDTNQTFTASAIGNYAVEITNQYCVDTSNCRWAGNVGLFENGFGADFRAFPNPTDGELVVELGQNYSRIEVRVFNVMGQQVNSLSFSNRENLEFEIEGAAGFYLIEIIASEEQKASIRIFKK